MVRLTDRLDMTIDFTVQKQHNNNELKSAGCMCVWAGPKSACTCVCMFVCICECVRERKRDVMHVV